MIGCKGNDRQGNQVICLRSCQVCTFAIRLQSLLEALSVPRRALEHAL
jgi:hypothetical protein